MQSRLRDVDSALAIFTKLREADEKSAINRARLDAMFDGAAPYDQGKLNASNQSTKTNLNFGEAQRLLDISIAAYVDLYSSLERLIDVRGTLGSASERTEAETIVGEELTHLLRSWPEFHSNYMRLCNTFLKHGVAVTFFDSPSEWKFRVGGFSDILIPRQTPASEHAIDVAAGRREYLLHELYGFIKNEAAAAKVGWSVDEVKRVIKENARTTGRSGASGGQSYQDYESLQAEIKNNDLYVGIQNPSVAVVHMWVREMDGTVSHYIFAEDKPKDFLYKRISRYQNPEQAFLFFTYGVGSNGTYHSVRGLGQRIFAHIQTSNRLRCQQVDAAYMGSSVMIQPDSQRALDELQFSYFGAFSILSPGATIVEKAIPNLSQAVTPALEDLTRQLQLNTDTFNTYTDAQGSPYRSQTQVAAELDISTRLSGANTNLFYLSFSRLMREIVRRVVENKRKDPEIKAFFKRCGARGVAPQFIETLDLSRTKAVRAIGNGSAASRLVALRELMGMSGQFDETGRSNLVRDLVASRVGADLADRYKAKTEQARPTVDTKIVYFENKALMDGEPVPVVSNEMHGTHLEGHLPVVTQLLEQIDQGQIPDPAEVLPVLQAFYQHLDDTAQQAAGDPALAGLVAQTRQTMQYVEEVLNNTAKAQEAEQRAAMEAQSAEGAPEGEQAQQVLSMAQAKAQAAQISMDIAQRKAELDMTIKQQKHQQDLALRDAKAAFDLQQQGGLPQ